MGVGRAVAAIALVALWSGHARAEPSEPRPITKLEARQWPDDVLKQRVLEQLKDVLIPVPYHSPRPPTRPLTELGFWTRPQSTTSKGVCSSDDITIGFRFDQAAKRQGALTPSQATSLKAVERYHVADSVGPDIDSDVGPDEQADADEVCAGFNPLHDRFFSAPDAETAQFAAQLVDLLRKRARDQQLKVDCHISPPGDAACRKRLSELKPSDIAEIENCEPAGCEDIDVGSGLELRVMTLRGEPTSVRVGEEVIIADERID